MESSFSAIKINSLKPWKVVSSEETSLDETNDSVQRMFKFKVCSALNQKVFLCQGGISRLELDCVVLPINEMTLTQSPLADEVNRTAGSSLAQYYKTLEDVKTGNVVLGSGFDLPARFIIHAMEPGMNVKFQSAVENAVHRCYRSALQTALEKRLKTVGFATLYENIPFLLNEDMAHTALRTVRCCLEKYQDHFEAVVFCVRKTEDLELYSRLLPAYFPRSYAEAHNASPLIELHNVGEWGDRVDADRAIRISHIPLSQNPSLNGSDDEAAAESEDASHACEVDVDKRPFSSMDGDHDAGRLQRIKSIKEQEHHETRERVYRRLLLRAYKEDFRDVDAMKPLYLCGCDREGDRIAVVIANRINFPQINDDKAILYIIRMLDPVVNGKYSLVYFHTMSLSYNHPPANFIKRVYSLVDRRYIENMKRFYMIHPSLSSRVFIWFFSTFSANGVKRKITTVKNIPELYKYIAPDQIDIPPFVSDYDLKVNLEIYHKEVTRSPGVHLSEDNTNYVL